MKYAMKFIDLPDAGCITLFGALPCTWGSGWQDVRRHLRGDDPAAQMPNPQFQGSRRDRCQKRGAHHVRMARLQSTLQRARGDIHVR